MACEEIRASLASLLELRDEIAQELHQLDATSTQAERTALQHQLQQTNHNIASARHQLELCLHTGSPNVPVPGPMDLVWDVVDHNGIPMNPRWRAQVTDPGSLPNPAELCPNGFGPPGTTQNPTLDLPDGWNGTLCGLHGSDVNIPGHVNWFAGTYEGPLVWESHSAQGTDDDYNFRLVPPNQAGLTTGNTVSLGLEFDSDETIDHFTTPWWMAFHSAVDDSDPAATEMVSGQFAIVTGLVGLDCEHSCKSELHPVWAMAVRVNDNPFDEEWAIFVRNWGNEGYCSKDQHYLDLPSGSYTFRLPWRSGASAVTSDDNKTQFLANSDQTSWGMAVIQNEGVVVTFNLPGPSARPCINGELHLQWSGEHIQPISVTPFDASTSAHLVPTEENTAESHLAALRAQMTSAQAAIFDAQFQKSVDSDSKSVARVAIVAAPQSVTPVVRAEHDVAKEAKDQLRATALQAAFDGNIPGLPPATP